MERGDVTQNVRTTGQEDSTQPFLAEAIAQLVAELGIPDGEDLTLHFSIRNYPLPSEFNESAQSDNRLTLLRHRDRPAALVLETRDERNEVVTQTVYFGPRDSITDET